MNFSKKDFQKTLTENILVHKNLISNYDKIKDIVDLFSKKLINGNTIFTCGNGGSASDSEHLSTEFLVRLKPKNNRRPYKILNLGMNNSYLTACSNDFNFKHVFSRSLSALARPGDVLWAISTSGNSKNIKDVLIKAKELGVNTVGFYGKTGGIAKKFTEKSVLVGSKNTARIQECHIFLGHLILEKTEEILIKKFK